MFASFNKSIVWVISYTDKANDLVMKELQAPNDKWPRPVKFKEIIIGSLRKKPATNLLTFNNRLCAAVLVLEMSGLSNKSYRDWIEKCISRVINKDDFCLLVWPYDMTVDVDGTDDDGDELLEKLINTVQIPKRTDVRKELVRFLKELDEIRNAALWRRLHSSMAIIVELIAVICQASSIAITIFLVPIVLFWNQFMLTYLSANHKAIIIFMSGIVYFPLLIIGLPTAFLWLTPATRIGEKRVLFARLALLVSPWPSLMALIMLKAPSSWYILGMVAGFLIDVMRRGGRKTGRVLPIVDHLMKKTGSTTNTLQKHAIYPDYYLDEALSGCFPNPFIRPIWPDEAAKVFISYSRSSSRNTASELHDLLCKWGVKSFRDEDSIREGLGWRKILTRKISESNVFIAIADSTSVRSFWPPIEMEIALILKRLTGSPHIIVLKSKEHPPEQPPNENDTRKISSVFKHLLRLSPLATNDNQPQLLEENDSTLSSIVSGLRFPHFHASPAVIPKKLASLLLHYAFPFFIVMRSIGSIGILVGWGAIPLALLQMLDKFNVTSYLTSHNLLSLTSLVWGYWLGYVGRFTVLSRFQVKMPALQRMIIFAVNLVASIGFIGLFTLWILKIPAFVIGWAVILCSVGWLVAGIFWHYTHLDRPEIKRFTD